MTFTEAMELLDNDMAAWWKWYEDERLRMTHLGEEYPGAFRGEEYDLVSDEQE